MADLGNEKPSWVCLMYHDVMPAAAAVGGGPERFAVPLESFERMLDLVVDAELRGCSMSEAISRRGESRVAITFDDGSESQFKYAAPALLKRGMTATFFVTTDWIGGSGFMSARQLKELVSMGMSVQSHTKSHPFLAELDAHRLRSELAGSKSHLDELLEQDTTEISLPGGNAPRRRFRYLLEEAGYQYVAGSRSGTNADVVGPNPGGPWLRRCTIRGETGREEALGILEGGAGITWRARREAALNGIRTILGPSRYARWRRYVLDRVR